MARDRAEAGLPERRSLEEIAGDATSASQAKRRAIEAGYSERQGIKCSAIWKGLNIREDVMKRQTGRINVATLIAIAVIAVASFIGCGNGNDEPRDWFSTKGDLSFLGFGYKNQHQKDLDSWANAPKDTTVAPQQFLENSSLPGYWNDGMFGFEKGSRHFYVANEQPGLANIPGAPALVIPGFQSGTPINVSPAQKFSGWSEKTLTNTELPSGNYRNVRAVKIDSNGQVVAEALARYDITIDDAGNMYSAGTEMLAGVPGTTGDIYVTRFGGSSTLHIRTAGKSVQVLGSWDNGAPHNLLATDEDVNGWSSLVLKDVNGNLITFGRFTALLIELNADGSAKGLFDMSKSRYVGDIPVAGSTATKKGIIFFVEKGVVYGNVTTAPALVSMTTEPVKANVPSGGTFTFDDVIGVFANGWRASVKYNPDLVGNSSNTNAVSVSSALSYKGEAPGTSNVTLSIGGVISSPATELTAFDSFLKITASVSPVATSGTGNLTAELFEKDAKKSRDVTATVTWSVDKSGLLTVNTDGSYIGGTEGNPIVTGAYVDPVTNKTTTGTITIVVQPRPLLIEIRASKTTIDGGEELQLELISINQGSSAATNRASEAKWSIKGAGTISVTGKLKGNLTGGKAEVGATLLGLTALPIQFTVNVAPSANSITTANATITVANTATVDVPFVANLSNGTPAPATLVSAPAPAGAPFTTNIVGDKVQILPIANRSASNVKVTVTGNSGKTFEITVNTTATLAKVLQPASQTLQVSTTGQTPALKGELNNSANTGGATQVDVPFADVTFGTPVDITMVTGINASGLIQAGATAGTTTVPISSKTAGVTGTSISVTTTTTPPPVTADTITPSSATISIANTATQAGTVTFIANMSNGTTPAATLTSVDALPAGSAFTAVVSGSTLSITPVANRSCVDVVVTVHGDNAKTAQVSVSITATLAKVLQPASQTLQVSTTGQTPALKGELNNSANTGGATQVDVPFADVTFGTPVDITMVTGINASGLIQAGATAGTTTVPISSKTAGVTGTSISVTVTAAPVSVLGQGGDPLSDPNWRLRYTLGTNSVTFVVNPAQTPNTLVNTAGATPAPFGFIYKARSAPATASAFVRTGWTVVSEGGVKGYSITLPIDPTTGELFHLHHGETVGGIDKWNPNAGMFLAEQSGNGTVEPGEQNKLSVDVRPATATTPASVTNGGF